MRKFVYLLSFSISSTIFEASAQRMIKIRLCHGSRCRKVLIGPPIILVTPQALASTHYLGLHIPNLVSNCNRLSFSARSKTLFSGRFRYSSHSKHKDGIMKKARKW